MISKQLSWLTLALSLIASAGCNRRSAGDMAHDKSNLSEKSDASSATTAAAAAEPALQFARVANVLQVKHVYENGEDSNQFAYVESIGGGVAVMDFDADGWEDLFFPGGGLINEDHTFTAIAGTLWRNIQGTSFSELASDAHADDTAHYSNGCAAGDVNNDGFPDLLVTGYGGLQLFLNQGDGTFFECAASSGLIDTLWSVSAGFGDLNGDGSLDFYATHNTDWSWENNPPCTSTANVRDICPPAAFHGLPDIIFISNEDGTYRAVQEQAGLKPDGRGLAVMLADLNQDNKLDVYVANDTTANFLFRNKGDATFDEIGVASGSGLDERGNPNGSMGIAIFDIDGNLLPDLWITNYENETCALYKNDGDANFRCVSSSTGIMALGTLFVGFGTVAGDFDLDGDQDIAIANGHVLRFPSSNLLKQYPLLLRNSGSGKLVRQQFEPSNYFGQRWRGRGLAAFDFDKDGDLDLIFSHVKEPVEILANQTTTTGNWCSVDLIGTASNRNCIGAKVVFQTSSKKYLRTIVGGGSYLTQNPYRIHLGFPQSETLIKAEITWPDGKIQEIAQLQTNSINRFTEPR